MTLDTSDRKSIRRAEKAAELADRNRGEVLIALASTAPGRRWLWELLGRLNAFASVYSDSASRMAFLEGRRSAGLELLDDWMHFAPDTFIEAMREANGRRTIDDAKSKPTNGAAGEQRSSAESGWESEGYPDAPEGNPG